jgi:hypothetical protein
LKRKIDLYQSYKSELSKLLRLHDLDMMSKDKDVINRIFNLLTENLEVNKIEGIISTTEILKYGGDIEDDKVKNVFMDIKNWWENNGI